MKANPVHYRWLTGSLCIWLLCAWIAHQPTPVKKARAKSVVSRQPAHPRGVSPQTTPAVATHPAVRAVSPQPLGTATQSPATGTRVATATQTPAGAIQTDPESGLALDTNLILVKGQCTACHSSKLILQSHFDREKWIERIRWMQRTQKLWDLGESEPAVLAYLTKYYGPLEVPFDGRRLPLTMPAWYKP